MPDYNVTDILSDIKVSGVSPFRTLEEELWSDVPYWVSTSASSLNWAIGGYRRGFKGGIPAGRCTEIFGPPSAGKSVLLDHIIKNFLNAQEGIVLLGDREHAHEKNRMIELGIDPTNLVFIEIPSSDVVIKKRQSVSDFTLEEFFDIGKQAFQKIRKRYSDIPILLALDSLAMTPTDTQQKAIIEHDELKMNEILDKSKVMSARFPDFCDTVTKSGATLVVVNQMRTKPGVVWGDATYAPGGEALPFAASLRIKLNKGEEIKPDKDPSRTHWGNDPIGLKIKFKIEKNKVAPPFRKGSFSLFFDDRGILDEVCFADFLIDREMWNHCEDFEKAGSWYSWKGDNIGQGPKGLAAAFLENPLLMKEMEEEILG